MADQQQPGGQGGQQPIQVRVDETKMQTTYANVFRTFNLAEGMVVDFGLNLPVQSQPGQPQAMQFGVGSRVVMTWAAAKQLAANIQASVRAYEQRFGEIPTGQRPPDESGGRLG